MTTLETRIAERVTTFGVPFEEHQIVKLAAYLTLLQRWNPRVNLTALSLTDPIAPASIDKLVIEPLCAAPLWPDLVRGWYDLGTGGGSPAIPLRIFHPDGELVMVEARGRKCAFLNEAVRMLALQRTRVINSRFEDLTARGSVDLITVRAVRPDLDFSRTCAQLLGDGGTLLGFGCALSGDLFAPAGDAVLPDQSRVTRFNRVFHVEHPALEQSGGI